MTTTTWAELIPYAAAAGVADDVCAAVSIDDSGLRHLVRRCHAGPEQRAALSWIAGNICPTCLDGEAHIPSNAKSDGTGWWVGHVRRCIAAERALDAAAGTAFDAVKRIRRLRSHEAKLRELADAASAPQTVRDLCADVADRIAAHLTAPAAPAEDPSVHDTVKRAAGLDPDQPADDTPVVVALTGTGGRNVAWAVAAALWAVRDDGDTVVAVAPTWAVPLLTRIRGARHVQTAHASGSDVAVAANLWEPGGRGPVGSIVACLEAAAVLA